MARETLTGWGRYPRADCRLEQPRDEANVQGVLQDADSAIARGNGRSYGDSSLNPNLTVGLTRLDRMLAFDPHTGVLVCEAGVLLEDVIAAFLPRGWLVHVTPGTRFVTIGGMIASDVHGKNHHTVGSFCDHLEWVDLALEPGRVLRCSRDENAELFAATCGGMGLTGVILRTAFRLQKVETAYMREKATHARNLTECLAQLEAAAGWSYTVAWTDCLAKGDALGRSVVFLAEHARLDELPAERRADPLARVAARRLAIPIDFPEIALNRLSVKLFNEAVYRVQRDREGIVGVDKYFYPLDSILHWNRIYGSRGFVQHQCVLPPQESAEGLRRLLTVISNEGDPSFLVVLKAMGAESFGLLSFPKPGYTLALDFPAKPESFALLDKLDAITAEHGGRIYLAKDARMSPAMLAAGYPRLAEFRRVRQRHGLTDRFASLQSRRLEI